MTKKQLIIDCDPGIDDTLALLYALRHPDIDVLAITVVAGNVPAPLGVDNVFRLLERLDRLDIPVYLGAEHPLVRPFVSAQDTHGMDGLGETYFEITHQKKVQSQRAQNFLADFFSSPQPVTLVALGPLTNIAQALELNPQLGQHCAKFVSMGGTYKSHGNCSPVAEYNYWCDPDAASLVYNRLDSKIHMVGLDVTRKIVLTPNILAYANRLAPDMGAFITAITGFYLDFHWAQEHVLGCVINDPLAVAYALNPDLCKGFDAFVDIQVDGLAMGQSIVDAHNFYQNLDNTRVLTQVDHESFWLTFLAIILAIPSDQLRSDLKQLPLI